MKKVTYCSIGPTRNRTRAYYYRGSHANHYARELFKAALKNSVKLSVGKKETKIQKKTSFSFFINSVVVKTENKKKKCS